MSGLREAIDALPRYIVVVQSPEGWTEQHSTDPIMHEAILLADVRKATEGEAQCSE